LECPWATTSSLTIPLLTFKSVVALTRDRPSRNSECPKFRKQSEHCKQLENWSSSESPWITEGAADDSYPVWKTLHEAPGSSQQPHSAGSLNPRGRLVVCMEEAQVASGESTAIPWPGQRIIRSDWSAGAAQNVLGKVQIYSLHFFSDIGNCRSS
jgi:hypothetical protein